MRNIQILGVPFNFGQDHPGVKDAYSYLKTKGMSKMLNAIAPVRSDSTLRFWERNEIGDGPIKYAFEASIASRLISQKIEHMNLHDDFLLNIGGDHGMALGSIHGILAHRPDSVIIWLDAHGDINTPKTSPSGNFHGMPLAFLLKEAHDQNFEWMKRFILPQKLILIGPRDLDQGEKEIIVKLGIQYFSSDDLNTMGAKDVIEMAIHRADPDQCCPIHLSFDVDVFDAHDFESTGTRVEQGPRQEEIFLLAGLLAESGRLRSMDVVEFNPSIGHASSVDNCSELVLNFMASTIKQAFQRNHEIHFFKTWNSRTKISESYRASGF